MILNKKDIIALNEIFEDGSTINESSLDFALSFARKTTNWHKSLAILIRAILLDHVFEEGNKRTAAILLKTYVEHKGFSTNDGRVVLFVKKVIEKNISNLRKLEEMIKDAIN